MANRVTIDVEARFIDKVSSSMSAAEKNADKLNKTVKEVNKELDKTGKKKVKPSINADDNAFVKKIRDAQKKADKLGKTKVSATLGAVDKASAKIGKVTGAAKAFGSKVFRGSLTMADKASSVIGSVTGAARSFASRTFSAAVKIVDYATTPIRKIKDALFNLKTLAATIVMGAATKQFIMNPINLADQYSGAKIGFSTLLGEKAGQAMMNDIDEFAKATPFKTSNTISSIQKMMAYGWDATRVLEDMETIGNAAAATGKGDQGLESIVYALSEIRSKGKLSTQELNQLASAGIKAKQYLAQGLGFGTDDKGLMKLSEALEDGAIGANQAIDLILEGMKEFDGMMDKTANETVSGLWSQLTDTFEINIFRKWGQGLQDGAKKGFGSLVELLNTSQGALEDFGDLVYDIGKELSNWAADKLAKTVEDIKNITNTDTFRNASLGGKIKILWDEIIAKPFSEWWETKGKSWFEDKAASLGKGLGTGITTGLLAILGIDYAGAIDEGSAIGSSFAKGFAEGFDGKAITEALVQAISDVWKALPKWAKGLIITYGAGKAVSGIGNFLGGAANLIRGVGGFMGSAGAGTGLLGFGANTAIARGAGNLAGGASLSAGALSALGLGATAGGIIGGVSAIKGGVDLYKSYKAFKSGDETEGKANLASGGTVLGGVAAGAGIGAAIGSVVPVLGTGVGALIGAGIGGIAGWVGGAKWAEKIREDAKAARFETEELKEAINDAEVSAEDFALQFERAVNENIADHFGDIKLSLEEIQAITDKIMIGDKAEDINKFVTATETAATSMQGINTAAEALDRLNWKVGLGLKLNEAEMDEYRASVDNYIASAKKYVEDKHYEFTAAVTLLIDTEGGAGLALLENGNTLYSGFKSQIEEISAKLSETVNIALEDGVITLDEQAEIVNLQNQIAEITNKLAKAETEAEFEALKIKFGEAHISDESFKEFQSALSSQLEESSQTYQDALTVSLTNLQLQYDEGLIDETEYKRLKDALEDSFNSQMEDLQVKAQGVQVEIIAEAYEDVLGDDAAAKLSAAIEQSLKAGISPAEWTTEDVHRFLNIEGLTEESAGAIANLLSGVEFSGDVVYKPNVKVPDDWDPSAGVAKYFSSTTFEAEATVHTDINAVFGEPDPWEPKPTQQYQTAYIDIDPIYNLKKMWTAPNFSQTVRPTVNISPVYTGATALLQAGANAANNATGNIINSKTLTWVAEEGPESIIPLVPSRRQRGLALWEETGRRLGVQYHAEGGIVGGSTPISAYSGDIQTSKEQKIEINMGGVSIEIKADGNKPLVENIEEQEQAIAEKVAEIFNNVFKAQFENTPLKGTT